MSIFLSELELLIQTTNWRGIYLDYTIERTFWRFHLITQAQKKVGGYFA